MFVHCRSLVIEWGDCDPAGIVFYPRFFAMFDTATAALLEAASGMSRARLIRHYGVIGWPMVDTRATFHAPVSFDDKVGISSSVTRLGRSSFDVEHALRRDETLCVSAMETRVWALRGKEGQITIQAAPLPGALRDQLSRANQQQGNDHVASL
jgi:4-hydroxybenzoyl-CoA thioesterase